MRIDNAVCDAGCDDNDAQNFQSDSTSMAQGTTQITMSACIGKQSEYVHFVRRVFEKIFSIGTLCSLHQAAVILPQGQLSVDGGGR